MPRLFGARQHPIAHAQRRAWRTLAPRSFDYPQPGRRHRAIRLPVVGNGHGLAILDGRHAQHGHARDATHGVERGALAVDQPFFGHVFQQSLQCDFFMAFQPELARYFALARRHRRCAEEIQKLTARGQPRRRSQFFSHGQA